MYPVSRLRATIGENLYNPLVVYNYRDCWALLFLTFHLFLILCKITWMKWIKECTGSLNLDKRDFYLWGRLDKLSMFVFFLFSAPSFLLIQKCKILSLHHYFTSCNELEQEPKIAFIETPENGSRSPTKISPWWVKDLLKPLHYGA